MNAMPLLARFALCLLAIPSAHAATLIVSTGSDYVAAVDWEYRSVATRHWLGCWQYDVLQGSGWYPSTYYNTYTPEQSGYDYRFTTDSGFWRNYCAAQMDQYNHVRLQYQGIDGTLYQGSFRVIPDGDSRETNIECWIDESRDSYNQLDCDDPHVIWSNSGTTTINIFMVE